jgi:pimeloyl-ACP methyl ester carboxylesterase
VLRLEPSGSSAEVRVLVFLPGFLQGATSYRMLLEPLTAQGFSVIVPQLYRRGPAVLTGRYSVEDEARDAAALVRGEADGRADARVLLGGHSRGGQAAWRAANLLADDGLPAGLVLLDPVDGAGRAPSAPTASSDPVAFTCPCLVVGAGIGGRCAPEPVNHNAFAAAAPYARHVVVPTIGHGDILDDGPAARARRLCGGAPDPAPGRATVTALLTEFVLSVR